MLGIIIAISLEHLVESWQWDSEVKVARKAITQEISTNEGYFARRIAFAPCIWKQINEAEAVLASLEAGMPAPPFTVFRPGSGSLLSQSEWESERASQTLTHFPRAELAVMNRHYARYRTSSLMTQERRCLGLAR